MPGPGTCVAGPCRRYGDAECECARKRHECDRDVTFAPDGDYREGFWAYCSACGHRWHITHDEWMRWNGYEYAQPHPVDPNEIKF